MDRRTAAIEQEPMHEQVQRHLKGHFKYHLFDAALSNLANQKDPLRFDKFAYFIRELVRHVLTRLALDDHVRRCLWFRRKDVKFFSHPCR